ncbi:uncharacterized protein DNG_09714 [Cephalotrichum gorgonifer]|uniref:Adh_short domain-containing protein n=1 Tax=Cephalotrichum gorgonifer TaxID=2041049 RepID=A0AAE8SZL3_9PEZI|nr:uncharacterized protein DNG_09714 [Cephalotrichum gorgonifer]
MSSKVLFIIGGGPRIGHSVSKKFLREGYQVAIGRRNTEKTAGAEGLDGVVPVYTDVTKPESIAAAFEEVEAKLGTPNIVVYNAAAFTPPSDANDPFRVPTASFENDLTVNVSGAYTALHHATQGFQSLKAQSAEGNVPPFVFIATGNVTPFTPLPIAVTLGTGKAALAYLISAGAVAYKEAGFRFYFASQVTEEGRAVSYPGVSGDAHGDAYWRIVKGEIEEGNWDLRFVANSDGSAKERRE